MPRCAVHVPAESEEPAAALLLEQLRVWGGAGGRNGVFGECIIPQENLGC